MMLNQTSLKNSSDSKKRFSVTATEKLQFYLLLNSTDALLNVITHNKWMDLHVVSTFIHQFFIVGAAFTV